MEKYRKVRSEREAVPDGIIRVNRNIQARVFIDQVLEEFNTKNKDTVVLSSLGEAITKSVTIAEIVKHRVAGLHQVNEISTIVIDDEYEPIEEGLEKMTVSRKLTCLQIVLSKKAPTDKSIAGYQEPIPASEVNPDAGPEEDARRRQNPRRGNRDGKRPNTTRPDGEAGEEEKKETHTGGNGEGQRGGRGGEGRRRRRGGSGENRRGGRGGQGGNNQAQSAAAQDAQAYNPFGDNKGVRNAADATPGNNHPGGPRREGRGGGRGRGGGNRDGGNRDGGNRDGGNRDGGNRDGGNRDGGNRDGGNRDGGNRDGGNRDGGNRDGGRDNREHRDREQGDRPAGDGERRGGRRGGRGGDRGGDRGGARGGDRGGDPYAPVDRK
jgi:DNA-binding protein